jgi:hypothetical protein
VGVPAEPTAHVTIAPKRVTVAPVTAARQRLRLPAHIGGAATALPEPALVTPDFAAADVRRATPGGTATVADRPSLVTASLGLLMLLAASGSFLLLAHRLQRGTRPTGS